ncbi:MAG: hypothetical protein ACKOCX_00620 [Planctomycetota bacterium]
MTRPEMSRGRPRPAETSSGSRRAWASAGLVALVGIGLAGWLWLGRGDDLVSQTLELERTLLEGGAPGRAGKRAVAEIVRNVDRMSPEELREVQGALEQEWQRALAGDLDAYFAAAPDDRQEILDRGIDRTLVYKDLLFAVNPRAWSKSPRRPRKPPAAPTAAANGGSAADAQAVRRQLLERYELALRQRARERGIELPSWQ